MQSREEALKNIKLDLKREQRQLFRKRFFGNKSVVIGFILISFMLFVAFIGPLLIQASPFTMNATERLQAPQLSHWLGTDEFGRDLLSRVVHGAQVSILVGLAVTFISAVGGLIIGLYASYYPKLC